MTGWDARLPVDVSLDDLTDAGGPGAEPVLFRAIDRLRSPATAEQLAAATGLDRPATDAVLRRLRAVGLIEELPAAPGTEHGGGAGAGAVRFRLGASHVGLHGRDHESCDRVLADAATWLGAIHAGEAADRGHDVRVARITCRVGDSLEPDILAAELRTAVVSHAVPAPPHGPAGPRLEVQIVIVRRDAVRHEPSPPARA